VAVVPCPGGDAFLRRLFDPLGYAVSATRHPLDEAFPEWGAVPSFTVTLEPRCRLRTPLTHPDVLVPVPDADTNGFKRPPVIQGIANFAREDGP
jgi:hypothetical protein